MPKQSRIVGAASLVAAQAIVLVLGYITHPLVGRLLGKAAYGVYGVVLSMQSIVGLLLTLGVPVALSRFVARDEDGAQTALTQALKIQTIVALVVSLFTIGLAPGLAQILGDTTLTNYIRFSGLVIFLQAYYPIFAQFLSGLHRFNRQALLTSSYAVVKLVGALGLLTLFGVYGALGGFAVGGVVAAVLGWWWARQSGGRLRRRLPVRSFLQFGVTYVLILVGLQVLISLDLFMVKALLRDDALTGDYNAAVTLSRISYMLLQGLAFILLPSVSKLTRPGAPHHEAAQFIGQAIRYLIMLIVPSVALAAATSKALIILFFSHTYVTAAPALTILMVGLGALAFYLLLINIVAGAGRARVGLVYTVLLLGFSVGLGFILIPTYGLLGAAWQTTIVGVVGLAVLSGYTFRTFGIPYPLLSTLHVVIASAVAVAPTYFWETSAFMLFPLYVLCGAIYIVMLGLLGEITPHDRQLIAKIHPKLRWIAQ